LIFTLHIVTLHDRVYLVFLKNEQGVSGVRSRAAGR